MHIYIQKLCTSAILFIFCLTPTHTHTHIYTNASVNKQTEKSFFGGAFFARQTQKIQQTVEHSLRNEPETSESNYSEIQTLFPKPVKNKTKNPNSKTSIQLKCR